MEFEELKDRVAQLIDNRGLSDVTDAITSYCDDKRQTLIYNSEHETADWWRKTLEIFSNIQFPD